MAKFPYKVTYPARSTEDAKNYILSNYDIDELSQVDVDFDKQGYTVVTFIFEGRFEEVTYVKVENGFACGYRGEGTTGFADILEKAHFDPKDINRIYTTDRKASFSIEK